MRNEILDGNFKDEFRNLLQADEQVIWDGKPSRTKLNKFMLVFTWILLALLIYFLSAKLDIFTICLIIGLAIFGQVNSFLKSRNTRYLLTDKRLLFQLRENRKKVFHDIPLEQITSMSIEKNGKQNGTIFISLKNPKASTFKTRDIGNGQERILPSLELISDVETVKAYIESAAQKRLS